MNTEKDLIYIFTDLKDVWDDVLDYSDPKTMMIYMNFDFQEFLNASAIRSRKFVKEGRRR